MTEAQASGRAEALAHILGSPASKKLIIAGPGTGKTFTFKKVVEQSAGRNLALTFINALAADIAGALGELAETYTFHGYCRRLLHTTPTVGITMGVDYYPPLTLLQADDLRQLESRSVDDRDIEHDFHYLDLSTGLIEGALRSGNYYDAVGHLDSVYRVFRNFEEHSEAIPRFAQIVVDEYQDFSLLEARFIAILAQSSPTLVVGDDDQALYGFKHASADYIRDLAGDKEYERFELPYCSRCTQVLVAATHTTVERANARGLLKGRLDKRYECYMPDKQDDSDRYPTIVHAHCSVERNNAPYMAKYIHQRILEISPSEIAESRQRNYPAVLITGPKQFASRAFTYLANYFEDIELKTSSQLAVEPLDGYRRLAANPQSRLGWRIILYTDPLNGVRELLGASIVDGSELYDILPAPYRAEHLGVASLLQRLRIGEALTAEEILKLESAVGVPYLELRTLLQLDEIEEPPPTDQPSVNEASPGIIVTSLVGAKGLQAGHVFVVGMNEGHFPRANTNVTDEEVCCLLVALTRAKKSCTLVSCGRFGFQHLGPSTFLEWLNPHIEAERIDAKFFASLR